MTKHFCDVCGGELNSNKKDHRTFSGETYEKLHSREKSSSLKITVTISERQNRYTEEDAESTYLESCSSCVLKLVTKIVNSTTK